MKSSKVLVLESTEGRGRPLVELLRDKGYEVQIGEPGPASVRMASEFLPEFLILEVEPEIRTALQRSPRLSSSDPIDRLEAHGDPADEPSRLPTTDAHSISEEGILS